MWESDKNTYRPETLQIHDTSANGRSAVGSAPSSDDPWRLATCVWNGSGVLIEIGGRLDDAYPARISEDGRVVGDPGLTPTQFPDPGRTRRWTADGTGFDIEGFVVRDLSADGSVMVGEGGIWTEAAGLIHTREARVVSDDGTIFSDGSSRWTFDTEPVDLAEPEDMGFNYGDVFMSGDGSIILNTFSPSEDEYDESNDVAFYWTLEDGMQRLIDVLAQEYGLAEELAGWQLGTIVAFSEDDRYIVGKGTRPNGTRGYWQADLGAPRPPPVTPITEPASYAWAAAGILALVALRQRLGRA